MASGNAVSLRNRTDDPDEAAENRDMGMEATYHDSSMSLPLLSATGNAAVVVMRKGSLTVRYIVPASG